MCKTSNFKNYFLLYIAKVPTERIWIRRKNFPDPASTKKVRIWIRIRNPGWLIYLWTSIYLYR